MKKVFFIVALVVLSACSFQKETLQVDVDQPELLEKDISAPETITIINPESNEDEFEKFVSATDLSTPVSKSLLMKKFYFNSTRSTSQFPDEYFSKIESFDFESRYVHSYPGMLQKTSVKILKGDAYFDENLDFSFHNSSDFNNPILVYKNGDLLFDFDKNENVSIEAISQFHVSSPNTVSRYDYDLTDRSTVASLFTREDLVGDEKDPLQLIRFLIADDGKKRYLDVWVLVVANMLDASCLSNADCRPNIPRVTLGGVLAVQYEKRGRFVYSEADLSSYIIESDSSARVARGSYAVLDWSERSSSDFLYQYWSTIDSNNKERLIDVRLAGLMSEAVVLKKEENIIHEYGITQPEYREGYYQSVIDTHKLEEGTYQACVIFSVLKTNETLEKCADLKVENILSRETRSGDEEYFIDKDGPYFILQGEKFRFSYGGMFGGTFDIPSDEYVLAYIQYYEGGSFELYSLESNTPVDVFINTESVWEKEGNDTVLYSCSSGGGYTSLVVERSILSAKTAISQPLTQDELIVCDINEKRIRMLTKLNGVEQFRYQLYDIDKKTVVSTLESIDIERIIEGDMKDFYLYEIYGDNKTAFLDKIEKVYQEDGTVD
ncbi:MAG: hypothetical protein P1V18_00050 [Candidatus Gracilibacteria bacterium]|nr:hypothetical protein [Candidatus Gracilibacteria bacterium]